jgi:hypothetical protein
MPEYLSKDEVKQWRSSLEKITLEEFATRLGKVIEEEKNTNDLVDMVLKGSSVMSKTDSFITTSSEKISYIAQKAIDKEREIYSSNISSSVNSQKSPSKDKSFSVKPEIEETENEGFSLKEEVHIMFSKSLTEREQLVFDYFAKNKNQIVYAKDLSKLLDLPRDYVYKYIKNLRAKIEGDKLQNADNGGYVLSL